MKLLIRRRAYQNSPVHRRKSVVGLPEPNKAYRRSRKCSSDRRGSSSQLSPHEWAEKAWEALKYGLLRIPKTISDHVSKRLLSQSHKEFVDTYTKRASEGSAIKWLKFHKTFLFARHMKQKELPKAPDNLQVPDTEQKASRKAGISVVLPREEDGCFCRSGALSFLMKSIMCRKGRRWTNVAYDVMMSKIGDPVAPPSFVDASYVDHQRALTRLEEGKGNHDTIRQVEDKLHEICGAMFKDITFRHHDAIPSLRSSYESAIKNGGALGELVRSWKLSSFGEPFETRLGGEYILHGMWDVAGRVHELRLPDYSDWNESFQHYVDSVWIQRIHEPLKAEPLPILEPLKVRMITKGQAAEYYRAEELQKLMHGVLRKWPVFAYIGHPIDDVDWARTFGTKEDLRKFADASGPAFFVSGDYKAATDNLNPVLSRAAWEAICNIVCTEEGARLVETPYFHLGVKCLINHELHYPNKPGLKPVVLQSWGQLMGSPMSFPILCLVNLAATLVALDRPFTRDLKIRVNGDDIAFISTPAQYARWKEVTAACGLEFSLGKNYTSDRFLLMNSELRLAPARGRPHLVEEERFDGIMSDPVLKDFENFSLTVPKIKKVWCMHYPTWELVGFVNQSLLRDIQRKGMEAGKPTNVHWTGLGAVSQQLVRGIPSPHDRKRLLDRFCELHTRALKEAPCMAQKYFPSHLGGLGFACPSTVEEAVKGVPPERLRAQRLFAAFLACSPKDRMSLCLHQVLPLTGEVGEIFKSYLSLVNRQVPEVLRPLPVQVPWNKPHLAGGPTLLGSLLHGQFVEGKDFNGDLSRNDGGDERVTSADRRKPFMTYLRVLRRAASLLRKDREAACEGDLPIQPMDYEALEDWPETYGWFSVAESLHTVCSARIIRETSSSWVPGESGDCKVSLYSAIDIE